MAVLLDIRPDASQKEQIRSLRDQLETYLNGLDSITQEEIDALIANAAGSGTVIYRRSGGGSGGGGTVSSYLSLSDKPRIEGVILQGDKTFEDLNLLGLTNTEIENLLSSSDDVNTNTGD